MIFFNSFNFNLFTKLGSAIVNDVPYILTQEGKSLESIQLTMLIKMEPKRAPQKPLT